MDFKHLKYITFLPPRTIYNKEDLGKIGWQRYQIYIALGDKNSAGARCGWPGESE
jgi:hypothetical protein